MFNHNLDFKVLDIYIASKARYYDCGGYKEAGHVMIVNQNEFVAKRVLEIQTINKDKGLLWKNNLKKHWQAFKPFQPFKL
jgi:hypothetical protein